MVKELKKLFRSLINKSNSPSVTSESKLEIDAAVVPATNNNDNNIERQQSNEQQQQSQQQSQQQTYNNDERNDSGFSERYTTSQNNSVVPSRINSIINDNSQILSLQSSAGTLSVNPPIATTTATIPTTSTTVGEVNNVQNIYNFSNMDGLHIGNSILIHNNITSQSRNSNRNRNYVNNREGQQQQQQQHENNDELNEINLEQKQNKKRIKITPGIEQLFRSRVDVEESVLNELSEYVGKNYQNLMRHLGLTQAQIQIVELDYNVIGHKEIIFQLLLKWSEEFYEIANYGKLSRNLWRCNCREAVVKLEQILSRIQMENQKEEINENKSENDIEKVKCV